MIGGQNTKYALLIFFEHVEIYALFGRTKWTQNLNWGPTTDFKDRAFKYINRDPFFCEIETLEGPMEDNIGDSRQT